MVMYPADGGKPLGSGPYYIETEVRAVNGSHLSSCLLATARTGPTPPLAIRSCIQTVTGTASAGGAAACEFRYLRAYSTE
jgi:hypothetical protein